VHTQGQFFQHPLKAQIDYYLMGMITVSTYEFHSTKVFFLNHFSTLESVDLQAAIFRFLAAAYEKYLFGEGKN
jgi:hypothetical protein